MNCKICNGDLIRTSRKYVVCENGCGRAIPIGTAKAEGWAPKRKPSKRAAWIATLPVAERAGKAMVNGVSATIYRYGGELWCKAYTNIKASPRTVLMEGEVAVRVKTKNGHRALVLWKTSVLSEKQVKRLLTRCQYGGSAED